MCKELIEKNFIGLKSKSSYLRRWDYASEKLTGMLTEADSF